MINEMPDFYKNAIYNHFHGVIKIDYPEYPGTHNNVLFVRTTGGDYVTKFNPRDIVLKNSEVSQMAARYGILTPDISVGYYQGTPFEYYQMIPGQTLHEHIIQGMPESAVQRAFEDILTQFVRMGSLPTKEMPVTNCVDVNAVISARLSKHNVPLLSQITRAGIYLLNLGKGPNIGLYHYDITPKNVIVDKSGKLISFIDIDSMAICNRNFAFCIMANKWVELGFNPSEFYDKYEYLAGTPINRYRIDLLRRTMHVAGHFLFHAQHKKAK